MAFTSGFNSNRGFRSGNEDKSESNGFGSNGFGSKIGGGAKEESSGFGGSKFGAKEDSVGFSTGGFGGKTNDGAEKKESGFGGSSPSKGFGGNGFGGNRGGAASSKDAVFGGSGFNSKANGFDSEAKNFGFGASNGFGNKSGGIASESKASGFGGSGNFAEKKSSGFGGSSFGAENKNSGFGGGGGFGAEKKSSGFGGSSFGFGSNGFGGESKSSVLGGNGFGAERSNGFGGRDGNDRPRGCFNCGEEGHRKEDCPQPMKERSNKCFNCGEEGHRSSDCDQPKKQRGCFNCGQEGHRSSECTEERKPRTDFQRPDGSESRPASTFIPAEIDELELYKMKITQGTRFDEFFQADVQVTASGKQVKIAPLSSFADLKLSPQVYDNIRKAGYEKPTPIQQYAIPIIDQKSDLMACAQTGSGKTAAFLLPIIRHLIDEGDFAVNGMTPVCPRCVVVAPTRELVAQICIEGRKFSIGTMMRVESIYGGTHMGNSRDRISGATIIVATMGRLLHFLGDGAVSLKEARYIVLDEADRMLCADSFAEDVRKMMEYAPPKEERNVLLFSATFPRQVQSLAHEHLRKDYVMLAVDKIGSANPCITQDIIEVGERNKKDELMKILGLDMKKYKVIDQSIYEQKTLVFVNKKKLADMLGILLSEANLPCVTIHGDRLQQQRHEAISQFKSGQKAVLIATAVAERGLDIKGVDHVINYDLPTSRDDYVHRIGRTGRVGNPGRATSFYDPSTDTDIASALVNVLTEAHQVVPDFLKSAYGITPNFPAPAACDDEVW